MNMDPETEYKGDDCIVLPTDYMNSVEAAVDLYAEDLAEIAGNLEVQGLKRSLAQAVFRGGFATGILWLVPAVWANCL